MNPVCRDQHYPSATFPAMNIVPMMLMAHLPRVRHLRVLMVTALVLGWPAVSHAGEHTQGSQTQGVLLQGSQTQGSQTQGSQTQGVLLQGSETQGSQTQGVLLQGSKSRESAPHTANPVTLQFIYTELIGNGDGDADTSLARRVRIVSPHAHGRSDSQRPDCIDTWLLRVWSMLTRMNEANEE